MSLERRKGDDSCKIAERNLRIAETIYGVVSVSEKADDGDIKLADDGDIKVSLERLKDYIDKMREKFPLLETMIKCIKHAKKDPEEVYNHLAYITNKGPDYYDQILRMAESAKEKPSFLSSIFVKMAMFTVNISQQEVQNLIEDINQHKISVAGNSIMNFPFYETRLVARMDMILENLNIDKSKLFSSDTIRSASDDEFNVALTKLISTLLEKAPPKPEPPQPT